MFLNETDSLPKCLDCNVENQSNGRSFSYLKLVQVAGSEIEMKNFTNPGLGRSGVEEPGLLCEETAADVLSAGRSSELTVGTSPTVIPTVFKSSDQLSVDTTLSLHRCSQPGSPRAPSSNTAREQSREVAQRCVHYCLCHYTNAVNLVLFSELPALNLRGLCRAAEASRSALRPATGRDSQRKAVAPSYLAFHL